MKTIGKRLTALLTLVALFVQVFALSAAALTGNVSSLFGNGSTGNSGGSVSGIGNFSSDAVIQQLKKDFLGTLNRDLVHRIEDYELKGEVGVILTFSDSSLVGEYTNTSANKMTFAEFAKTAKAKSFVSKLEANQNNVLKTLTDKGLIMKVEHTYSSILDGAFVRTTYEQIEKICDVEGVERIMISNTYLPAAAVENPVDVYETGIFNSSDISFTGKGTIVAILDTGCDYTHSAFTTHTVIDPRYNRDDIAGKLSSLIANTYGDELEAREVYYGNITGGKIAYGYDYADKDTDIMPLSSEHGTHVAGIIGGYDDTITGVAIDTQFAIMKVFSDYEQGAEDGDIIAALEDSVLLGVDAINMSLGSSCGFSLESDQDKVYKNELYKKIEDAGISLVVAASNDYSSGFGSEQGNTNKTDNPDSATVGAPSTYEASLSVASINGNKENYMLVNGERIVFFNESYNMASKKYNFFEMLGVTAENPTTELEYVTVPGLGYAINYAGIDVNGKIALISRGDITFEEKVQYAQEAGAIAAIIYNNVFGEISMTVGNHIKIPVISITKDDGDAMAATEGGKVKFDFANEAGPFMSDFSSWGPNPDLKLKPEITAHGGNILSAIPGGEYEELSGTSMAAPNMCGISVLIRQYVKEKYPEMSVTEVRDLVNQLCMSTATIALDNKGNPYSPRKQGAGIADIKKSTTTGAYLYVDGIGKTKLELGDDPKRTGVYTMSINLKNLSDKAVSYTLGNITMTESISESEPEYVAEMAYLLSNTAEYAVEGGILENGVVTVAGGATAKVSITLKLSAQDKAYLNSTFANGMFVEGFVTFDNTDANGVDLNAPFLAFYGDWGEAPLFDLDYYMEETEAHNNAIDEDDKIKADYYATTPLGSYYYDYLLPLGCFVYKIDETEYTPIPGTREHAAVSYFSDAISGIYGVFTGLLRGAKEMNISIVDTSTGEEVWSETQYNCYKAHYGGAPYPYVSRFDLNMINRETGEVFGSNNTKYEVTMTAKLDWDGGTRNSVDTYQFSFYIDYEAPTVTGAEFRKEYDKANEEYRYYVDIMVYDNHYAMSLRPVVLYEFTNNKGEVEKTFSSLSEYPIPVYQENRGEVTKVTLEITDYIDIIARSAKPEGLSVYIDDYAMNAGIAYIPFPETDNSDLEFVEDEISLDIGATMDLSHQLVRKDTTETIETDYLKNLTWESSNPDVVAIKNGKIEAMATGTAVIKVTGSSWKDGDQQLYKNVVITVSDKVIDNPESSGKVPIESLEFISYDTLFAFNSDIDYSEIGLTDTFSYFDGNCSISCYPSEKVKLNYALEPWNLSEERYTLSWSSSNPKVATVDENGVVTAEAEGNARITLKITIDGKTSILAARCAVEVKSEFIIENRTLIAYKGKGGDVVIPDDEGILFIGAYAFCHFDLDNEKEVEKDENGYYDIDDKKTPLKNDTVTSVVIPEGVEVVEKYAFYNCTKLTDVTLPESCKTINSFAFSKCDVLENINLKDVNAIMNNAFDGCESLTCEDLGGVELSEVYAIGDYAFRNTRLSSVKLLNLGLTGIGSFSGCEYLENVELGKKTRIAAKMFENTAINTLVAYTDTVGDKAFAGCEDLTSIVFKNSITYLGVSAFEGCKKLDAVTFEKDCEQIAKHAFRGCTALKNLALPNCNLTIGEEAFFESGLKKLTFAANTSVDNIGTNAFKGIRQLAVDVSASNVYKLEGNTVYTKDGSILVLRLPTDTAISFVVPASVKKIGDGAFVSNPYIENITFAAGSALESIGNGAFLGCINLKSVTLPENAIAIGVSAFEGAEALKSINLDTVTSVGEKAFYNTALTTVALKTEGVYIGKEAFYQLRTLVSATIGAKAVIDEFAFAETPLETVEFVGGGVSVGAGAFAVCERLTKFDFEDLGGKVGDYAFAACTALVAVNAPEITEIGFATFADCYSLVSFSAAKLEIIGDAAFSHRFGTLEDGAAFETISIPSVKEIGGEAFLHCRKLKTIDLSGVTTLGIGAFYECDALETVVITENLANVPEYAFFLCTKLENIDLSKVVSVGEFAFYDVPMPSVLNLDNVETIGELAFFSGELTFNESDEPYAPKKTVVTINAPKLTEVGSQAFFELSSLKNFNAPKLQTIGGAAFAYTGIEKFQIGASLEKVDSNVFEGCKSFTKFYAIVDGAESENAEFENVKISDGVLYMITDKGYVLTSYPAAKDAKEYTVIDGTVRIDYCAAYQNLSLETLILPSSIKYIGNHAFDGCENLKVVKFNSYYAPTLEGTWTGDYDSITPENIEDFVGFEDLYKYNYYYRFEDELIFAYLYHYSNFKGMVANKEAEGLTCVVPLNSYGYDSVLYNAYFTPSETENSGTVMGPNVIAFLEAVKKLPEVVDRFDAKLIEDAITAYNKISGKESEMAYVSEGYLLKFNEACSQYNVSVVENKLAHLFDMDMTKVCFDFIKDARASFLALTEAERALVANASVLDTKLAELNTVWGREVNLDLTYEENLPSTNPEPPAGGGDDDSKGLDTWVLIAIIGGVVLVVAVVAVAVILVNKKKKQIVATTEAPTDAEPVAEETSEAEAEAVEDAEVETEAETEAKAEVEAEAETEVKTEESEVNTENTDSEQ